MANFYKTWISYIQSEELEKINLENIKNTKYDTESNKHLFKVLLHLSHCADKCYRKQLSKETEIFTVTNTICQNLTNVPDKDKYFSALYYIIFYLINKHRLKEAEIITRYLFPPKIEDIDKSKTISNLYRIATLWHVEMVKMLDAIASKSNSKDVKFNAELSTFMRFHFEILNFSDEKYQHIFHFAEIYLRKLTCIPLKIAFPYVVQIFEHLSSYIKNLKEISTIVNVYNMLILIVGLSFYKRNDLIDNSLILSCFTQCSFHILNAFENSSQCYNCYELFKEYSTNLFETNFISNKIGKKCCKILDRLLEKYGATNRSVMNTVAAISLSFQTLFGNWENLVSTQLKNTKITYDDITKMGDFVKQVHSVLRNYNPPDYICKKCPESKKCLVKKDIYATSVATSTYIRVLNKIKEDEFSEAMFSIGKNLLQELLLVYDELVGSNCDFSTSMWDLCGRLIFNFGLHCESKYPAELEELYERLCKEIVIHDGVDAKVSSFGLDNPVGTSLHRLCNSNFNRENYRKAMTYTAYNALLSSYENRKKKAYDMWANIKHKLIDSKDIQELTMLKCLKIDAKEAKKLNIDINLKNYDLDDLCLRELKSLFLVKGNVMTSIKKTLNELELRNSSLHFARGTLLLCFHALQFTKREFIFDYISKAIKYMQKSSSNQCLLANLKFFNIIEKLYARSHIISNQIEDANFTIKAFKAMKGNQLYSDLDDKEEVVPTFGGINIDEDNKFASELRDVLNTWESSLRDNIMGVINDWEPKYTLETIVICGEYCRLYKFKTIEEKCWKVAYKLATALKEFTTCIYVTSRSVSLRYINDVWISECEKYINSISLSKSTETDTVILFWLSLADFYLDCKKVSEAKVLIEKVKSLPNFSLLTNAKLYVYSSEIQFRNYHALNSELSQEGYCQLIVEIHYIMISLYDMMTQEVCRFWNIKFQLFSYEQMFEALCTMIIPMTSLLSYREISLHLAHGLKSAQKFGITLRIAEFIKHLCYIDLLRLQIDSCEAHLQDLEHVLCLDNFNAVSKVKCSEPTKVIDKVKSVPTVRDASVRQCVVPVSLPKNSASPELKKKLFSMPAFLEHTRYCQCFICTNIHYQYLIFSCSHIQAQLYTLLKYVEDAECHFSGACTIKRRLEERDSDQARQYKNYRWKRQQKYIVDDLLFQLDFSMFITEFKPEEKDIALEIIEQVLEIARDNDMTYHCVSFYAYELCTQHCYVNEVLPKLSISVPHDIPIDITNQQADNCITPKLQPAKVYHGPRRHKSPQPIALPVISIMDSSDEENDCGNMPVFKSSATEATKATDVSNVIVTAAAAPPAIAKKPRKTSARNVRRKLLADEEDTPAAEKVEGTTSIRKSTRLSKKLAN